MPYVDTSVVVAALTNEPRTRSVQKWMANVLAGELMVSDWVMTEFSSALSIKVRTGQLPMDWRARALAEFESMLGEVFVVLPLTTADFRAAARMVDRHATGLRAGDALHLSVVASHGGELVSLDRVQVGAAKALKIPARLI